MGKLDSNLNDSKARSITNPLGISMKSEASGEITFSLKTIQMTDSPIAISMFV